MTKKSGFTLTEMLVTIVILGITLGIGVPGFNSFLNNSSMVSSSSDTISAFNYARLEAMKRGNSVEIGPIDTQEGWISGIVVWVDNNNDDVRDDGEDLRLWPVFSNNSTVSSSQATFTFRGTGEVDNADVLTLCDDRTGEQGMQISILISGAVIPQKVTCG